MGDEYPTGRIVLVRHGETEWSRTGRHTGRSDVPLTETGHRQAERLAALREWDYGEYEGMTRREVRMERPGWTVWRDGCPGGEAAADVAHRIDRIIAELRDAPGDVAVFAHGHSLRVLAVRWIGLAPEVGENLPLGTAALSEVGWDREAPAILLWNETAHLDVSGDR